jgi:two-component system response regulator RpfG
MQEQNVLIVDDQASQRLLLREAVSGLDASIEITDFADPLEALRWSQDVVPDLVIFDYRMPAMDGLEFARRFRRPESHRDTRMMLVTCIQEKGLVQMALDAGINEVLHKPAFVSEVRVRSRNLLQLRRRQKTNEIRIKQLEGQLQDAGRREFGMLELLVRATCEREGRHVALPRRAARIAGLLARAARLPGIEAADIEDAAWLHDIGKLALPEGILAKGGPLTASERGMMRKHTVLGYQLLKDSLQCQLAAVVALYHHERWDGAGYPDGLMGDAIPLAARVVAIASTLNALTAPSVFEPAWPISRAIEHVREMSGTLFDPSLVEALVSKRSAFEQLLAEDEGEFNRMSTPIQWTGATLSGAAGR